MFPYLRFREKRSKPTREPATARSGAHCGHAFCVATPDPDACVTNSHCPCSTRVSVGFAGGAVEGGSSRSGTTHHALLSLPLSLCAFLSLLSSTQSSNFMMRLGSLRHRLSNLGVSFSRYPLPLQKSVPTLIRARDSFFFTSRGTCMMTIPMTSHNFYLFFFASSHSGLKWRLISDVLFFAGASSHHY